MWSFLACGFFRKFGLTSFFSIVNDYIVTETEMTLQEAAVGTTLIGTFSILGILLILFTTSRFTYSKVIPHAGTTFGYALCMFLVTLTEQKASTLGI